MSKAKTQAIANGTKGNNRQKGSKPMDRSTGRDNNRDPRNVGLAKEAGRQSQTSLHTYLEGRIPRLLKEPWVRQLVFRVKYLQRMLVVSL